MPKQVLIVEDTEDIANFEKIALEMMGLEVHHMNTPEKAVEFLEQYRPDLIVLDIGLPGMSGWQLLDVIKKKRDHEGVFVIVTTAFTDPANRLMGKLQDVDGYLFKPFQIADLKKTVTDLLEL